MEIRILQEEEINIAAGLSRFVFDNCLRNRMEYPQTIAYVEEYISEASLRKLCEESKLRLWGVFEEERLVGVSGLQADGMITMLYVLPQWQNRGYGSHLIKIMREYAKEACGCSKVTVNANPAWTAFFFAKKGFTYVNPKQNMRVPFVSMYAPSSAYMEGYEKRPVSAGWMVLAALGCAAFATIAGSLFMISYLF